MAIASSLLWIIGFALSVILGPTLEIWTWGPTMLCFAVAASIALPNVFRDGLGRLNLFILISGLASAMWFAGRAWFSPAHELALIDLSLVAMSVSTFFVVQHSFRSQPAQVVIIGGIALLLGANLAVMAKQIGDLDYNFLIPHKDRVWPAGFFRHYSHGAAFLIGSSLLLAGFSLKSTWPLISRIILLVIAAAGLAAVYITKSRSGMLGAGLGVTALVFYWALSAKRDDRKGSGLILLIAPLLLFGVIIAAVTLLENVQETRQQGSGLVGMLDNEMRLYLYGIAISCVGLHPFVGGGSRSFSWECYRFWDIEEMGVFTADPEHVHNEFVQVFTDYGIIGALILSSFIVGLLILCTFRTACKGTWTKYHLADAWRIGGVAAFLGILTQSNFEGILRIAPGAILLAICLAALGHGFASGSQPSRLRNCLLTACCIGMIAINAFYGWKGTGILGACWSGYYSEKTKTREDRISSWSRALEKWPLESIYADRGIARSELAALTENPNESTRLLEEAVQDFQTAGDLHPHTPLYPRNLAIALSLLKKYQMAEPYFERAIRLQGGMEPVYKTHFQYASHHFRYGNALYSEKQYAESAEAFESARKHLELTTGYIHGADFYQLQLDVHVNLGVLYQQTGDYSKALKYLDAATQLRNGNYTYHLGAALLAKRGMYFLSKQRQADALRSFMEAQNRLNRCQSIPPNLQEKDRSFLANYLKTRIQVLSAAKHVPSETLVFE